MKIYCSGISDLGKARSNNEDSYLIEPELKLFIVCDGMGGHQAGEIASSNLVEFLRDLIKENQTSFQEFTNDNMLSFEVNKLLKDIIQEANYKLFEMSASEPSLKGMGTTLVMTLILKNKAFVATAGDSRLYLFRNKQAYLLTQDHSIGNEISKTSLPHRYKSALTRAMGVSKFIEPDIIALDLLPGDGMLLTSDGMHNYFSTRKFKDFYLKQDPKNAEEILDSLLTEALNQGGADNITGIYLYIDDDPEKTEYKLARKKLKIIQNLNLFRYLTFTELLQIMNIAYGEFVSQNSIIFKEGDDGDKLYIILKGKVRLTKENLQLAEFESGNHFGEMALIEKHPRTATVTTIEDSLFLCINKSNFYQILKEDKQIAVKVLWSFVRTLSKRLRNTTEEYVNIRLLLRDKNIEEIGVVEIEDTDFDINIEPPPIP